MYLLFRLRLRILAYIVNHIAQNIVLIDLVTQDVINGTSSKLE